MNMKMGKEVVTLTQLTQGEIEDFGYWYIAR